MLLTKMLFLFQLLHYHTVSALPNLMSKSVDNKKSLQQFIKLHKHNTLRKETGSEVNQLSCFPSFSSCLGSKSPTSSTNNKIEYKEYKLKIASFTEECNTLVKLFEYAESQVLMEIMKKQESIGPTNMIELKDFHEKVNGLLVMLNDQKKEEFWRFVENNKEILHLFPSKPVTSSGSDSPMAVKILFDMDLVKGQVSVKEFEYIGRYKDFVDVLDTSEALKFLKMEKNWAETPGRVNDPNFKSLQEEFVEKNEFLASLNDFKKEKYWEFTEHLRPITHDDYSIPLGVECDTGISPYLDCLPHSEYKLLLKDIEDLENKHPNPDSKLLKHQHEGLIVGLAGLNQSRQENLWKVQAWLRKSTINMAIDHRDYTFRDDQNTHQRVFGFFYHLILN
ncbi:hypothetical protein PGTUg99_037579 [Puccinia graminis f. sp. tritici]|uniref:Uncharacterized protein n=1 Tax=Puccinia graminis f. sp. tritici TaxID=56615 RepID=A0A5B0RBP3_PUCGR|nr:hypothetical protein PGTUg99_037579 [Puccinia graminis f. sp. tritici]